MTGVLALAFLLAFCSFGFQTLIAFAVHAITGGQMLPWLTVLACFLLGLGIGSLRSSRLDGAHLRQRLVPTEIWIGLMGGLSVLLIFGFDAVLKLTPIGAGVGPLQQLHEILVVGSAIVFGSWVGYFSGYELPIILSAFDKKILGTKTHWVIGCHYFGTLVAAVMVQGFLITRFDVIGSALILGIINLTIALVLLWVLHEKIKNVRLYLIAILFSFIAISAAGHITPPFYAEYLKIHYFRPTLGSLDRHQFVNVSYILKHSPKVERTRSLHQYIDVINLPSIRNPGTMDTLLYLDTHLQFGSSEEKVYHEVMTHIPISAFAMTPKRVLIAGGGDGLLVRELLRYPEIEHIDLVELDSEILEMADRDSRIAHMNQYSLRNSKVSVRNEDAFAFLRKHNVSEKYDFILIDFPFPHNPDLARLYSREFYRAVKSRLKDNGFVALDFPLELQETKLGGRNDILFNTLKSAGFSDFLPFSGYDSFVAARPEKGIILEAKSPLLSELSLQFLKIRQDILSSVNWNESYVNSIFKPQSFGHGYD
jgi:spermidine synthase